MNETTYDTTTETDEQITTETVRQMCARIRDALPAIEAIDVAGLEADDECIGWVCTAAEAAADLREHLWRNLTSAVLHVEDYYGC